MLLVVLSQFRFPDANALIGFLSTNGEDSEVWMETTSIAGSNSKLTPFMSNEGERCGFQRLNGYHYQAFPAENEYKL